MARIKAEVGTTEKKIEELQYEHARAIAPLEKYLKDLNSQGFSLSERWKKLRTETATTAVDDRIKLLEKQVADQAALIRSLQGRADQSPGAAPEKAVPAPAAEPIKEVAPAKAETSKPSPWPYYGNSPSSVVTLGVNPPLFATIAGDGGRITMIDPVSKWKATYRVPGGSKMGMTPIVAGNDLFPLTMNSSKLDQLAIFDRLAWRWTTIDLGGRVSVARPLVGPWNGLAGSGMIAFALNGPEIKTLVAFNPWTRDWVTQDLKEPASGILTPALYPEVVACPVGRFFYAYSVPAKKWATLELKQAIIWNQFGERFGPKDGKIVVPEEDAIHIFDVKAGEWTHVDTKDEGAK